MNDFALPHLRAMSLPEVLDQAIRLYRQNFMKFVGIIAIPYIPLILIQSVLSYITADSIHGPSFNPFLIASSLGAVLFGIAQFFLVQGVATAALTRAVADAYTGQPVDIIDSYSKLKGSWGRLLFALIFMGLVALAAVVWFVVIPCVGWLSGMGLLIFLGIAVYPMVAPVVILENRSVIASVRRAWDLCRQRFWWILGFGFVITMFGQLVVTGPVLMISSVMQSLLTTSNIPLDQQLIFTTVIQTIINMVTNLLYLPLQLTAITVAYIDLRVRFEGLDLILLASEAAGTVTADIFVPQTAESIPTPLVTSKDFGFFTLLSFAGGIFYFLFGWLLLIPIAIAMSQAGL